MASWQQHAIAKQMLQLEVNSFVHTYSRKGKKGCTEGKHKYRATFFVGKVMQITISDKRVIELTLEHWAKATDDEGIIHCTFTPGGPEDWWTEAWCIDDDAPVSLIPTLTNPMKDQQTGDVYIQLNMMEAEAAIQADFDEEQRSDTDATVHESEAESAGQSKKRHANEDLLAMVEKTRQRRDALNISDDDSDG